MNKEYTFQGRIAIAKPELVVSGTFNRHSFSGVLIALSGQDLISDSEEWENIQCEIIIRPMQRLGIAKTKNMRLDQAALALSEDNQWK